MSGDLELRAETLPARIRSKFVVSDSGCWEWTASRNIGGYGMIWFEGRPRVAHRVAYGLLVGAIPDGLTLDHLCRVRHCVNPAHLEPVTMYENMLRGESFSARQARQTHCKNGHPLSGDNLYSNPNRKQRVCRTCRTAYVRAYYGRSVAA